MSAQIGTPSAAASGQSGAQSIAQSIAAGRDELINSPLSFFEDLIPGVGGSYVPVTPPAPNAFDAGVGELVGDPLQFGKDAASVLKDALPTGPSTTTLILIAVSLVALAVVASKIP